MSLSVSVYIMYTVWNRGYTGRSVEGVYMEFYSCGRIPSISGQMSVYSMYTGRIKGYTERGVNGMCTDSVYVTFFGKTDTNTFSLNGREKRF